MLFHTLKKQILNPNLLHKVQCEESVQAELCSLIVCWSLIKFNGSVFKAKYVTMSIPEYGSWVFILFHKYFNGKTREVFMSREELV